MGKLHLDVLNLLREEQIWQENAKQFVRLLETRFSEYNDIIQPLITAVNQIQLGYAILSTLLQTAATKLHMQQQQHKQIIVINSRKLKKLEKDLSMHM